MSHRRHASQRDATLSRRRAKTRRNALRKLYPRISDHVKVRYRLCPHGLNQHAQSAEKSIAAAAPPTQEVFRVYRNFLKENLKKGE